MKNLIRLGLITLAFCGFLASTQVLAQDSEKHLPSRNLDDNVTPITTFTQMILRIEKLNGADAIYLNNEGFVEFRHYYTRDVGDLEIIKSIIVKTVISSEEMQKLLELLGKAKMETLPATIKSSQKPTTPVSVLGVVQIFNQSGKNGKNPNSSDLVRARKCEIESIESLDQWEAQLRPLIQFLQDLEKKLMEKSKED